MPTIGSVGAAHRLQANRERTLTAVRVAATRERDAGSKIAKSPRHGPTGEAFTKDHRRRRNRKVNSMDATVDNKNDFVAAADKGLSRVAEAIITTPAAARVGVIDAVVESYRKTAREFLDEEETKKWLVDIVARLEAEVVAKERQANETQVETVPLVPTVEVEHAGLDALAFRL